LARGTEGAVSDVDLIVVGDVTFSEVLVAVRKAQSTIGREVNATVYPVEEFRRKLKDKHHFLKSVMENPKLFLVGEERELTRLGAKRLVDRA
jgi:predicted nucleotidyltransferase